MSPLAAQQNALLAALGGQTDQAPGWRISEAGLAAYRQNAQALAERCLRATYPVVLALIGASNAAPLAHRLWQTHPPRRGDLALWGAELPNVLTGVPAFDALPWLNDVARLEWAMHHSESAADVDIDRPSLARLAHEEPHSLGLRLASGTQVLGSAWPIASMVLAHRATPPDLAGVRDQIARGERESALIWRPRGAVQLTPCSDGATALLRATLAGASLPLALDDALASEPDFDLGAWLPWAVQQGVVCGVNDACPPPGEPT